MPPSILSKSSQQTKSNSSTKRDDVASEPKFPIRKYDYMEGRNYRRTKKQSAQFLPCDDEEIERLQVNHLLYKSLFVVPFFAPIEEQLKSGIRVLDISSGPGWWIKDMAETYPNSHFTGIDELIYPMSSLPINCHFRISDLSNGLPFEDDTFDFVTQHDVMLKYGQEDWDMLMPEIVRVTKPRGYVELVEAAGVVQDIGPNMSIWMMRLTVSLQTRTINLKIATQLQSLLEKTNQVEKIESSHRSAPIGWYGRSGDIMLECIERLFDSVRPKLCEDWSMSLQKYDKVVQAAASECRDFRSWINIHYVYAQKK